MNATELNYHRENLELPVREFWVRYAALGGECDLVEFEAALNGASDLSIDELNVAESALLDAEFVAPPTTESLAAEMRARSRVMRSRARALNGRLAVMNGNMRAQHARSQTFRSQLLPSAPRP